MRSIAPQLLDEISGPDALAWASEWSTATEAKLESAELRERIRASLDAQDKIP